MYMHIVGYLDMCSVSIIVFLILDTYFICMNLRSAAAILDDFFRMKYFTKYYRLAFFLSYIRVGEYYSVVCKNEIRWNFIND